MARRRVAIILALAACVPSAGFAAKVAVPVIAMPPAYEGQAVADLTAPQTLDRWWLLFDDPALTALEDEAFRNGPDALIDAARLLEVRETRRAQTAQTFPSGSISGTAARQKNYDLNGQSTSLNPVGGVADTLSGNFNVSWELDLFGRLATARKVAAADAAQALFNVEGTQAGLAAAVADAYFQAKGLQIQRADARETARIQSDLLDIARRKADAGAGTADAGDRIAGDLAQAQAQADDLDAQLNTTRRKLLLLIGRGLAPSADLPLAGDWPAVPATPASLPADLLNRRPDVRDAQARLRSAIGTARLRHLAVFPTITLLPGLGLSRVAQPGVSFVPPSTITQTTQVYNQGFWNLAAGITVPTLDIPKLLYQAKAEDARARQAAIAYERTAQTA